MKEIRAKYTIGRQHINVFYDTYKNATSKFNADRTSENSFRRVYFQEIYETLFDHGR